MTRSSWSSTAVAFAAASALALVLAGAPYALAQLPTGCGCTAAGTVTYRMTFTATWTDPTPPTSFPHWSSPIGTSHSSCYTMWKSGILSTTGMKNMAEFGSTGALKSEFTAAGAQTLSTVEAGGIGAASGTTSATFTSDKYHPLVSVATMIAPSPDWFAGVNSVNLCSGSSWQQSVTRDVYLWDAGTDSGTTWTAGNSVTNPYQVIERFTSTTTRASVFSTYGGGAFGTMKFDLVSTDTTNNGNDPNCAMCSTVTVGVPIVHSIPSAGAVPPTSPVAPPATPAPAASTSSTSVVSSGTPTTSANTSAPQVCGCTATGTPTYRMTFTATWSSPPPPTSGFPHWSNPIGTSHSSCYSMWKSGGVATSGIRVMAELGGTAALRSEFAAAGANALSTVAASGIGTASGTTSATFTADRYHPLVSVTTMIAPSPDWFAGVNSLNLCSGSTWKPTATVDVFLWDAGTDSGVTWNSANSVTNPTQNIERFTKSTGRASVFGSYAGERFGTMRFERISVDSTKDGTDPLCQQCSMPNADKGNGSAQSRVLPGMLSSCLALLAIAYIAL